MVDKGRKCVNINRSTFFKTGIQKMGPILIGIFTLVLIIVCILLVLVVLMQKPNADAGLGAALGGGAAEGIFGGETGNVLTRFTVKLAILYFVISLGLYLGYIYLEKPSQDTESNAASITAVGESASKGSDVSVKSEVKPDAKKSSDASNSVSASEKPGEAKPGSK